jgi:signal transduction histidine kinase
LANELLTREINERKRVEQDLRDYQRKLEEMSLELSLATDRERGRIAGELHDEVGQRLILSRIKLDMLANQLSGPDQVQAVNEIQQQIDQTIKDIRSLTFQLRPPILAAAGLVAAVHWLGEELKERYGLDTKIKHDGRPINLPYETKSVVFQVVRELLVNVAKHASTDRAVVAIKTVGDTLSIIVTDYGVGCDATRALAKNGLPDGFGLFNIQKLVEYLGGRLALESMPGEGCQATILIPFSREPGEVP